MQTILIMALVILTANVSFALDPIILKFDVPESVCAVDEDFPPCGSESPIMKSLRKPGIPKELEKLFRRKTGAIYVDVCGVGTQKRLRALGVKGPIIISSCLSQCIQLPPNAKPKKVELSSRSGGVCAEIFSDQDGEITFESFKQNWNRKSEPKCGGNGISCTDHVGWRDVTVRCGKNNTWFVCATAVNWRCQSNAKDMKLTIHFN